MAAKDRVVIISGCRTPVGKFQGSLSRSQRNPTRRHRGAGSGEARRS